MRTTWPLAPAAAAPRRPATPGTGWPGCHLAECARCMTYTLLVTSSQVFLGPTPIKEKRSKPPLRLAVALLETAAGMEGNSGSSPARAEAAQSNRAAARLRKHRGFIAEILLQIRGPGFRGRDRGF